MAGENLEHGEPESAFEGVATGWFATCLDYEAHHDAPGGPCRWCGWLEDDHELVAPVHALAPRTPRPMRRAS